MNVLAVAPRAQLQVAFVQNGLVAPVLDGTGQQFDVGGAYCFEFRSQQFFKAELGLGDDVKLGRRFVHAAKVGGEWRIGKVAADYVRLEDWASGQFYHFKITKTNS